MLSAFTGSLRSPRNLVGVANLLSVNLGEPEPNPYKDTRATGINKVPRPGPVAVRPPGPKRVGLGSGLVGDFVGDSKHHGGDNQAVYAYAREDLDAWEQRLDRALGNGFFGENLTTTGLDVTGARLGERWRIGEQVELQVTCPRVPCSTFRGWTGERGWLRTFTSDARPGAYLRVLAAGSVSAGDEILVSHRPEHEVTISLAFRALLTDRDLLPQLLAAGEDLSEELRETAAAYGA